MNKNVSNSRGRSRVAMGVFMWAALALALGPSTKTAQAQLTQVLNLTSFHDAGQHVFYVSFNSASNNLHLHHLSCSTESCHNRANQDLTAQTGVAVAFGLGTVASYNDSAGIHVFVVDDSDKRNLHKLDCQSNCDQAHNWTNRILASNVNAGLTGYSEPQNDLYSVEYLYYVSGGHVWVAVISLGEVRDLTLQTGAPPPGSLYLTSFSDASGEHLFYQDKKGHINQITGQWVWVDNGENSYQDLNWSWADDLTLEAGGTPQRQPYGSLTSFSDALGAHVAYIGSDQHIYQYWYDISAGKWQTPQDLSGSAALALQWSPLTGFADDWGEHFYYISTGGHMFRLYRNSCFPWGDSCTWGPWTDTDLTKTANAMVPEYYSYRLTGFGQSLETVFYVGNDCNIHRTSLWVDQDLTPSLKCGDDDAPQ
jgi:hypothetical protein